MAVLRYPRFNPFAIAGVGGQVLVDTGTTVPFWTEFGTPVWSGGNVTFSTTNHRLLSPRSRYFSFWCHDVEFDVRFQITAGTGTTRLRIVILSDGNRMTAANSAIEINIGSGRIARIGTKEAAPGATVTLDDFISPTQAEDIRRVRVILRKQNWTAASGGTGRQVELYCYGAADNLLTTASNSTSLQHGLNWNLWMRTAPNELDMGDQHASLSLEMQAGGGTESVVISQVDVKYQNLNYTKNSVYGPLPDRASPEKPWIPLTDQPLIPHGRLNPAAPPYNVNSAGAGTPATNLTQFRNCCHTAMEYSMAVHLAAGTTWLLGDQLFLRQLVQQRTSATAADRDSFIDEACPYMIHGSNVGGAKAIIRLDPAATGFSNATSLATSRAFIVFSNADYNPDPPGPGPKPNSNYNQQLCNVRIETGAHVGAVAFDGQGAQGSETIRVEFVATGAGGFAGMRGGSGAGGSHATGKIIGYKYGLFLNASQPGAVYSGWEFDHQGTNAVFIGNGDGDTGPRGSQLFVGCRVTMATGKTAFDGSDMSVTNNTNHAFQRGLYEVVDTQIEWDGGANVNNWAFNTNRGFSAENCWFNNLGKPLEHPGGDVLITGHPTTGWTNIKRLVKPYDPPTASLSEVNGAINTYNATSPPTGPVELVPADAAGGFRHDGARWHNGVRFTTNIIEWGPDGVAPPVDLYTKHQISDSDYKTFENATIDLVATYGVVGDGVADDTTALQNGFAAATAGSVVYLRQAMAQCSTRLDLPAGAHLVGASKVGSIIFSKRKPTAGAHFGSGSAHVALLRTAASALKSQVGHIQIWKGPNGPTGFNLERRDMGDTYAILLPRADIWGFATYPSTPLYAQAAPHVQWTGANVGGRHFHLNQGVTFNVTGSYAHYEIRDAVNPVYCYALNPEHSPTFTGNIVMDNCERVVIYGMKNETNWPWVQANNCRNVLIYGVTGNPSAFIPPGEDPIGENPASPNGLRGYNPAPASFPAASTPALFYMKDVDNFRISQTQDEGRFESTVSTGGLPPGIHDVFGAGTRPDKWHFGVEVTAAGVETLVLPTGARPTYWSKGNVFATATPPILSAPTTATIGNTTVTPRVTTDTAAGTLYMVLVPDGDAPSAAQIKLGQQSSGAAAIDC